MNFIFWNGCLTRSDDEWNVDYSHHLLDRLKSAPFVRPDTQTQPTNQQKNYTIKIKIVWCGSGMWSFERQTIRQCLRAVTVLFFYCIIIISIFCVVSYLASRKTLKSPPKKKNSLTRKKRDSKNKKNKKRRLLFRRRRNRRANGKVVSFFSRILGGGGGRSRANFRLCVCVGDVV